jgi:hypothetical protein
MGYLSDRRQDIPRYSPNYNTETNIEGLSGRHRHSEARKNGVRMRIERRNNKYPKNEELKGELGRRMMARGGGGEQG